MRVTALAAIFATHWKYNLDHGYVYDAPYSILNFNNDYRKNQDYNHETGLHREQTIEGEGWRGWPFKINSKSLSMSWWTQTDEPTWKKHVSPEEAERGPPTNL